MLAAASSLEKASVYQPTMAQLDWQDSVAACESLEGQQWQLPSIDQLMFLFYFHSELKFVGKTDYWSNTRLFGRGFGLNTHWGILSYDVLEDEDHFLCVKLAAE